MIAKRNIDASKKPKQGGKRPKATQEEKDHREMIREVTRLLSGDEVALGVVADQPSVIGLLHADELIQSSDRTSQAIGLDLVRVFLLRPTQFPDKSQITKQQKVIEALKSASKSEAK